MEEGLLNHFKQSEAFIRSKIDIVDGDDHNGDGFENNELFLGLENASLKKMINQLKTYEHRLIGLPTTWRTQATIALNEKNAMIEKTDPQACAEISRIFKDQRSILDELAVTRSEINKIKENQRRELINMLIRGMADTEKSNSDTSISLNEILELINNFSDFVIIDIENFTASRKVKLTMKLRHYCWGSRTPKNVCSWREMKKISKTHLWTNLKDLPGPCGRI